MNTPRLRFRVHPRSSVRFGMTLIELLVGIVITGAAVSAGYATFSTLVDQQQRAKFVVDNVARGAAIRRQLTAWIQDGYIQLGSGGVPRNGLDLGSQGSRDELRFFTMNPTPLGGLSTVVLYVNQDNPRYQPGLIAEFSIPPFNNMVPDTMVVPIDSTITGMRVEYLLDQGSGIRQWVTAEGIGEANVRPTAVRLFFISSDPEQLTSLLHIPLVVPILSNR